MSIKHGAQVSVAVGAVADDCRRGNAPPIDLALAAGPRRGSLSGGGGGHSLGQSWRGGHVCLGWKWALNCTVVIKCRPT
jgi:hypothetical protein